MNHETMTFLTVESPNEHAREERDDTGLMVTGYTPDDSLPEHFREALARVLDAPEGEAMCDLASLMDEASGQMCSNWVGWHLYEDDDEPHRSGIRWRTVVLVETNRSGGVAVVCEDCSPDNLYDNARIAAAS